MTQTLLHGSFNPAQDVQEYAVALLVEGEAFSYSVHVTSEGLTLDDIPCKYVKLENWDTGPDFDTDNPDPIYWGYRGNYAHRLAPGGNSELLPVNNLSQICVRCAPANGTRLGLATLFVSYYR